MMTITAQSATLSELDVDAVAVGVFKGGIEGPGATEVLAALGLDDFPVTPTFRGDVGQTLRIAAPGQPFRSVLLVGLGRMDGVSPTSLRRAAGDVARALPKAARIATTLAEVHPTRAAIEAVADGLTLGAYTFDAYRSSPDTPGGDREAILILPSSTIPEAEAAIERSRVVCEAVAFARDLVNTPAADLTPEEMAARVAEFVGDDVTVAAHDDDWLAERGCGALLGVARGAVNRPRLVELTYEPENPLAHVVLAGKGITYDTGGLNIKPPTGMMGMKGDMGGAAAVAAAIGAIAQLGTRVKVTGLLGLVENAFDGSAQRPSDVVTACDGTTIEVAHTDAEGRLVLADALAHGASLEPDAMIDLATLTGSAVRALGPWTAALMGADDVAEDVARAAEQAGESVWRLPLQPELDARLDTSIADVHHLGPDGGPDAIMAALFLRRFTGDLPWAHLDIAGPSDLSAANVWGHQVEGGTGFGVATIVTYLQAAAV